MIELSASEWQQRAQEHAARVHALTAAHLDRRRRGEKHPVEDFLFDYYDHSPARLARWHPGPGTRLLDAAAAPQASWRHYLLSADGTVALDAPTFRADRAKALAFVRAHLTATLSREIQTGCLGLHEWAMVYRQPAERRHGQLPLRLGSQGTDAVLEASTLRCTHFDATRFFTPEGAARNTERPTREEQTAHEQPGCLHAGMDLYRWSYKLAPAIPSELTVDAFELAREIRTLDMQASPYDLAALGYEPVRIEEPEGRREYAIRQRAFAERANQLRQRILSALDALEAACERATPSGAATATAR